MRLCAGRPQNNNIINIRLTCFLV